MMRRGALGLVAALALGGCGFRPVYMPSAGGAAGPAERNLAAIHVALIPDRPGQLLRQALQQRLHGADASTPRRYILTVNYWIAGGGVAILPNSIPTRIQLSANAVWTLTANDGAGTKVTSGYARAQDGVDLFDQQYFAIDLNTSTAYHRLAGAVADDIALRLAAFFRARADSRAGS
ncbi:MAG: hypothetical protein KGI51_10825 [Rhodospirillales bacterium]|nr:hypothetical protein [Rhodospirillales bacterium]